MPSPVSFDPGRQPADRDPAPDALGLVQAFVNTSYDLGNARHGEDVWTSPEALARWLRRRGLLPRGERLSSRDLKRAKDVRDGIRALLIANNDESLDAAAVARLKRAVPRPALRVEYSDDAPLRVLPVSYDFSGALGLVVALVHGAMEEGIWDRFKACRDPECRWAFYDYSRNQASAWCSMAICGSRDKVRNYRLRQRGTDEHSRTSGRLSAAGSRRRSGPA